MNVSRRNVAASNEELIPMMLRVPESMHETIKKLAKEQRRSLNFQLVHLLEEGLKQEQEEEREPLAS